MCYVQTAKCRTHLFVIRPSSSPEMAFLYIPQILLHQGAREKCACAHFYPNNSTFLIKSAGEQPTSDQSYSEQACQTDAHQVSTQEVEDH